jgi:hypothetical protein
MFFFVAKETWKFCCKAFISYCYVVTIQQQQNIIFCDILLEMLFV